MSNNTTPAASVGHAVIRRWLDDRPYDHDELWQAVAGLLADHERLIAGYAAVNTGDVYLVAGDVDGDGPTVWCGAADDPYPLHVLARYELAGTTEKRDRVWAALTGHLPTRAAETDAEVRP
jgi:hypothetical protein